jgi:hypothetical protein
MAGNHDAVFLLDAIPRVHQPHGQLAVIREQEQAPALQVESAHGKEATCGGNPVHDGRPAARIAHGGEETGWLVDHQVGALRRQLDPATINRNQVTTGLDLLSFARAQTVHGDAPRGDQFVGLTSGGEAGLR